MNITLDLLKRNGFQTYPNNTLYLYNSTNQYQILIKPYPKKNTNNYICEVKLEYFVDPYKNQILNITNIEKLEDLKRVYDFFNIDFVFKI